MIMKSSFLRKNKKVGIFVFFTAFLLRMVFCIPVFMDFERATGPGSDSQNYLALAEHLLEKQQFSVYEEETGYREAARTPGYPLFIAFANLISGGRKWFVIMLQCILEAFLACAIFALAGALLNKVLPGLLAAMLYSIHPHQALYTTQVLSEILFTFVLFLSIASFIYFVCKRKTILILLAGGLLGIATLIRPISLYFVVPIIIVCIFAFGKQLRFLIKLVTLFLLAFFVVLSPWYIRNIITYDKLFFATIGSLNIGFYNAAFIIAKKNGVTLEEAQLLVAEEVKRRHSIPDETYRYASDNPEICAQIASYGFEVIRQNPGKYAALHMIGFLHTFVPMEYTLLYKLFGKQGVERVGKTKAISKGVISDSFRGRFASMFRTVMNERFRKFPWWFTTIWFAFSLFQLLIYFLALRGFAHFWKQQKVLFLFFLLTIIYFAILPGPVGDARFRVPIEPILVLLAGAGLASKKAR